MPSIIPQSALFDITDYGALPNGSDCTQAFQSAIAAAQGKGYVFIPGGEYRVNNPIVIDGPVGSTHSNGPKFVGVGDGDSIISYKGINSFFTINQRMGYRFVKNTSFNNLTLNGVSTTSGQHALTTVGAWDFYLNNTSVINFGGHGIYGKATTNVLTSLGTVNRTANSATITKPTGGFLTRAIVGASIIGSGIPISAIIKVVVSDTTLILSHPVTASGPVEAFIVGNTDAIQSIVHLNNTKLYNNTGLGIYGESGLGFILKWKESTVQGCKQGGVILGATVDMEGGVIAGNGSNNFPNSGLKFLKVTGVPQNVSVSKIEFDSNYGSHVDIEYLINGTISQCRFISHTNETNDALVPNKAVEIGGSLGSSGVRQLIIDQCAFRTDTQKDLPFTGIHLGDDGTYADIDINRPNWITPLSASQKKINKTPPISSNFSMTELGKLSSGTKATNAFLYARKVANSSISAGGSTILDFTQVLGGDPLILNEGMKQPGLWQIQLYVTLVNLTTGNTGYIECKFGPSLTKTIPYVRSSSPTTVVSASFDVNIGNAIVIPKFMIYRDNGSSVASVIGGLQSTTLSMRYVG